MSKNNALLVLLLKTFSYTEFHMNYYYLMKLYVDAIVVENIPSKLL